MTPEQVNEIAQNMVTLRTGLQLVNVIAESLQPEIQSLLDKVAVVMADTTITAFDRAVDKGFSRQEALAIALATLSGVQSFAVTAASQAIAGQAGQTSQAGQASQEGV
jgi:predicted house-cleaning NTP pyrophosphatase (Maf/HAM1 superfamily)